MEKTREIGKVNEDEYVLIQCGLQSYLHECETCVNKGIRVYDAKKLIPKIKLLIGKVNNVKRRA